MKIKSRKEREKEYEDIYGDISLDTFERLRNDLGKSFNEDLLLTAINRINENKSAIEYNTLRLTFYEIPIQSHRPRVNYHTKAMHVPNAKANHDEIEKFVSKLNKSIRKIATPMKIKLTAYYPMPKNISPLEEVLYETQHDYAIGKPDFDNVLKAYSDMLLKTIILDDDLVSSCEFNKYFSLKPRVELEITYPNGYSSEYTYKRIKDRKVFKELQDYLDLELLVTPNSKLKRRKKK